MMKILHKLRVNAYETADGESRYTGLDIIELAKGNVQYAQTLLDRATGYAIETMINDDLMEEEVVEQNGQYLMTGGTETIIVEVRKGMAYCDDQRVHIIDHD